MKPSRSRCCIKTHQCDEIIPVYVNYSYVHTTYLHMYMFFIIDIAIVFIIQYGYGRALSKQSPKLRLPRRGHALWGTGSVSLKGNMAILLMVEILHDLIQASHTKKQEILVRQYRYLYKTSCIFSIIDGDDDPKTCMTLDTKTQKIWQSSKY